MTSDGSSSESEGKILRGLMSGPPWWLVLAAYLVVTGLFINTGSTPYALALQSVILMGFACVYVSRDWLLHGKLTLVGTFVGISGFVFGARGAYMGWNSDLDILAKVMIISPSWAEINEAMGWSVLGLIMFMIGALVRENWAIFMNRRSEAGWSGGISQVAEASGLAQFVMLIIQCVIAAVLIPWALRGYKVNLVSITDNAYLYLLPTLSHGVNLYIMVRLVSTALRTRSVIDVFLVFSSLVLVLFNAYLLNNLSSFRGFWLSGIVLIGVAVCYLLRGRLNPFFLVGLFLIYPFFKQIGLNRGNTTAEIVQQVMESPFQAYSKEGLAEAFGGATDLNMLDTFVASYMWDHSHRPYVLSVLYTFAHWVPRRLWPSKPEAGCLADVDYTNGAPYSPGIVGMFNDDGGELFMLFMMAALGGFIRYMDIVYVRIGDRVLQSCVFSILFFGTLIWVRMFTYQVFYASMSFFVPMYLMHKVIGKIDSANRLASPVRPAQVRRL